MAAPKMCLIEVCGSTFVLPIEDARKAFEALCDADEVHYDWSTKVFRRRKREGSSAVTLRSFSPTELAQLAMEDPTT